MHEMGIANSIIETVITEMAMYPSATAQRVGVRIGELAAVEPSALKFCFDALIRDTELEKLQLEIEVVPRRHRCGSCENEFQVKDYDFACPRCGSFAPQCIGGDDLELSFLEVDEHEPAPA